MRLACFRSDRDRSYRAATPDTEFFEKRIRPLFAQKCQGCHGDKVKMGGLSLSSTSAIADALNCRIHHKERTGKEPPLSRFALRRHGEDASDRQVAGRRDRSGTNLDRSRSGISAIEHFRKRRSHPV